MPVCHDATRALQRQSVAHHNKSICAYDPMESEVGKDWPNSLRQCGLTNFGSVASPDAKM